MKIEYNPGAGGLEGRVTKELRDQKMLKVNLEKEFTRLRKFKRKSNENSSMNYSD